MDEQLDRLREFDQDVLVDPSTAQSYATNGFLDTLTELMNSYDDAKVIKDTLRAFTTVLPHVFNTVCQNEVETRLWETTKTMIDKTIATLDNHTSVGPRISAIKCLQVLILLFSKPESGGQGGISLSLVRAQHRLLNIAELEEQGKQMLQILLDRLKTSSESASEASAVVNALVPLVKDRQQFTNQIVAAFIERCKSPPSGMTPVQTKSVDKVIKIALTTLIRMDRMTNHRAKLIEAFGSIGGNTAIFQSRQARVQQERERREIEEARRKRPPTSMEAGQEKRSKLSHDLPKSATSMPSAEANPMASFVVTSLPLPIVTELVMAILQSVSTEVISERIASLPPDGLTGTRTRMSQPSTSSQTGTPAESSKSPSAAADVSTPSQPVQQPTTAPTVKAEETMDVKDVKMTDVKASRVPLPSMQERATQSLKMQPYELADPGTLHESEQFAMLKMAVQRILDAGCQLQTRSAAMVADATQASSANRRPVPSMNAWTKSMWMLLVAKLLTRGTGQLVNEPTQESSSDDQDTKMEFKRDQDDSTEELKHMLLDFIVADLPGRHDLALEWLHEEFYSDTTNQWLDPTRPPMYGRWLLALLQKALPKLETKDKTLAKLLLDAPAVSQEAIDMVKEHMENEPTRFVACVSALRELVANRPPIREACLSVLLDYCINPDVKRRTTSIVAVKKWVPDHAAISPQVEAFAIQQLQKLKGEAPKKPVRMEVDGEQKEENEENEENEEKTEEDDTDWSEPDVVRHAELFFALCAKKNELLDVLFDTYIGATERVQRLIRLHIYNLIKSIGMHSPKLLEVVRNFPPGGETLVIRILVALCDKVRPSPELVVAVKQVYQERNLDAKFLIPVVSGLSKDDLRQNLGKIVELLNNTEAQRKVVKKVFSRIVTSSATVAAPMTPTELLLALHEMEENVPLPKAVEAINICFTMPDTFESKYVASALQHLVDQPKIPLLLMVTMIRTVSVYKNLVQFVLSLLQKLTLKKVWAYPKLWDGFVKCTQRTLPDSVKMAAGLPKPQLKEILLRIPDIQSPLRDHAEEHGIVRVLVLMKEMGLIEE